MNHYQRFLQKIAQVSNRQKEINKLVAESNKRQQQSKNTQAKADKKIKRHANNAKKWNKSSKIDAVEADIDNEAARQSYLKTKKVVKNEQNRQDTARDLKNNDIKFHKDK